LTFEQELIGANAFLIPENLSLRCIGIAREQIKKSGFTGTIRSEKSSNISTLNGKIFRL